MATRGSGTFLISWAQTELDGLVGTDPGAVAMGSTWRWNGSALRVDCPRDILLLENPQGSAELHLRAASKVRQFLGELNPDAKLFSTQGLEQPDFKYGFEVTDGIEKFQATLVYSETALRPLILFSGALPSVDQDLWVVSCTMPGQGAASDQPEQAGTVCFVPGTKIKTPIGEQMVQDLEEGDQVCTKDNGIQTIRWIGKRDISGGRLFALPQLRPVRLKPNALSQGEPDQDLVVSPDHKIVVKGPIAQSLFNTSEVLVAARDLINGTSIRTDHSCTGVTYIHLMLDQHQIIWANNVQTETFHPACMAVENIAHDQRAGLWERFPDIQNDVFAYGEFARRNLSRSEAAVLSYGTYVGH